ncbi:type II toxin-antitoxin system HicB family antitoxin [Thomasclavelia ramosa]|uniref:type II toxin-antitoxin system HicB family antitoxin n=1 Tax=Thomasclavelia ramosa TaxID=1547 RepID=UPI0032BF82A9
MSVYFPDVDGCYSQGESTEEALYMAKDALELVLGDYIPSLFKDAPKSSEIRSLNLDKNQCIALIEVDIEQLIKKFEQNG